MRNNWMCGWDDSHRVVAPIVGYGGLQGLLRELHK